MTRKRFIKLLMGNGWSRNWARMEASEVILDNVHAARVNHTWKLQGVESFHRLSPVPYEFCLPIELQRKYNCGYYRSVSCITEK